MLENNLQDRHEQTVNSDALIFSPTKETSPFFCGCISFGKSYSTATCCQGCQSPRIHITSHCGENTEGIMGGIHQRSSVLSEHCHSLVLHSFLRFLLLGIVGSSCQLLGYLAWPIFTTGHRVLH